MIQERTKLFYDLNKATQFGSEVEKVASEITVQTGRRTYKSIIGGLHNPDDYPEGSLLHNTWGRKKGSINPVVAGEHYHIDKEKGSNNQDIYYVRYFLALLNGASWADKIEARRQADEYLEQKYQELGPDAGRVIT